MNAYVAITTLEKWGSNQCINSILANFHFHVKTKLSLQKKSFIKD